MISLVYTIEIFLTQNFILMVQAYKMEDTTEAIRSGRMLLLPSDTVWIITCHVNQLDTIHRINELRGGKETPFCLIVSSIEMLKKYVEYIPPKIETLLHFHTHPLTMVYEKGINLPEEVLGDDGSVAIRISRDPLLSSICDKLGSPILGLTANSLDDKIPGNFGEIKSNILQGVDKVLMVRQKEKKKKLPSVIARMGNNGELDFIRE